MGYGKNVLEYLDDAAARVPDKTAVQEEQQQLTFLQLQRLSRRIGTAVARLVQAVRRPVAVLCDRQALAFAGLLGVLQSGNCYVPLEARMPQQRLEAILNQLQPAALLYLKKDEAAALPCAARCPLLCLEQAAAETEDAALLHRCRAQVLDVDPAYLIYTSGSTGMPKGIVISHRALIDFTEWIVQSCEITGADILADQAPLYFDTSVKNLYPALKCGATVHLLPKKFFSFPLLLIRYLNEHRVTAIIWSTSAFHLVANSGVLEKEQPQSLRLVAVGGEALQARQLNLWRRAAPKAVYYNHYGPTEVTVDCAWYRIDRAFADGEAIPIGRACENMELLLLAEDGRPVPAGTPGEICVRGIGLACGYYGDWDKTDGAFVQNPLNPWYPDRIYRTGDLGIQDAAGNITFLARRDNQIKHMGYRIELGEIETALYGIDGIRAAVCFFDEAADKIVCVYEGELTDAALVTALRTRLPKYMLPNRLRQVAQMPYNANGKIDRVRLKEEYADADR
ncbi:MAG: amino acid adenylation domain-containing protein [Clostridiales bacterium]|nr:amino acid adenylation domain-containing protein [Clostridiales bacterium]